MRNAEPKIIVTAKTLPEHYISTKVLERSGFKFSGMVLDKDIGDTSEWTYEGNPNRNLVSGEYAIGD